ncbi:ABC transporter permease [Pyxidicoccus caerfyrddinensis]|uniref:ABC transporter permease n=1 Tax=Pyxidicoccus caerfyrddinensis TaxID=2709663 RepID=UPI0013DBDCB8|nr:ABC transporter permease [Pyxidicoccus caerfyrddinensis]
MELQSDVDEEISFHLDMRTEALMRGGLAEAEARERALREFGDVGELREALGAHDARAQARRRVFAWLDALTQDLRFGVRTLWRSPGFTLVAVLTVALGVGANTALFGAVHAVLLRPLPYAEPDRLVAVAMTPETSASQATLLFLRGRTRTLTDVAGYFRRTVTFTGSGEPEVLSGAFASAELFSALGVAPGPGRALQAADNQPGAERVAVLGHGLWLRRFGGDPGVVGRTVTLDGMPFVVVGVMPRGFSFPGDDVELWLPLRLDPTSGDSDIGYLTLLARLATGTGMTEASAELRTLGTALRAERPDVYPQGFGDLSRVRPLRDVLVGEVGPALLLLLGAVGCVLLIACANVAGLLLARVTGRRAELAVRAALGAGAGRLARQMLTESVLLGLLGGLAGLVLARWGADAVGAALPGTLPDAGRVGLDGPVLAFGLVLSLGVGLLFGLAPAWRVARGDPHAALRAGGTGGLGRGQRRLLGGLVAGEVALALMLMVGASLMLQTVWKLRRVDAGFTTERVLTLRVELPDASYGDGGRGAGFFREALERVRALPGVESVGAINRLPLESANVGVTLRIEGRPTPLDGSAEVDRRVVTSDYFDTLRVPLLRGRVPDASDARSEVRVALVNEALARRFFPGEDALGHRVWTDFEGEGGWTTIVGVVGDTRNEALGAAPRPQFYRPHVQIPAIGMTLVVRTRGEPLGLARAVREALWAMDPDVPVDHVRTLEQVAEGSIATPRLVLSLLVLFALLALVLGAVGLYGVMSYAVGQRTYEFGVRLALGASGADVLRQVAGEGLVLAGTGIAAGLVLGVAAGRVLSGLVFGVGTTDPLTLFGASLVLATVALLASLVPAWRAARVDPGRVLRGM